MIPTIEAIVEGLLAGTMTKAEAVGWLHQHAQEAGRDYRDDIAMIALQGILAAGALGNLHEVSEGIRGGAIEAKAAYGFADAMLKQREL